MISNCMFLSPLSHAFVHDFELHVLYSELMLTYIPPRMYTQERVCNCIYKEHMFLILSKGSISYTNIMNSHHTVQVVEREELLHLKELKNLRVLSLNQNPIDVHTRTHTNKH